MIEERKLKIGRSKKITVPAGTSSYQACWIVASDDDEDDFPVCILILI